MQLSIGLHVDTFLLQVQLNVCLCCVNNAHQLWSRHPLASCKADWQDPCDTGEVDLPPAAATKIPSTLTAV